MRDAQDLPEVSIFHALHELGIGERGREGCGAFPGRRPRQALPQQVVVLSRLQPSHCILPPFAGAERRLGRREGVTPEGKKAPQLRLW